MGLVDDGLVGAYDAHGLALDDFGAEAAQGWVDILLDIGVALLNGKLDGRRDVPGQ